MKFELNQNEQRKANEFIDMCHMIMRYAANSDADMKILTFNYIFCISSGIGQNSAIECEQLEIGINLTDYKSW